MNVLPLTLENLDRVALIEQEAGSVGWTRAQFEKELTLEFSRFFVLQKDRNILGYGGYWKIDDEAQITNIAILPQERRHGLGRFLLQYLLDHAKQNGCRWMTLEVRESNVAALSLYKRLGFEHQTMRPRTYSSPVENAILMKKDL